MDTPSYLDIGLDRLGYKDGLPSGGAYNGVSNLIDDSTSLSDLESGEFAEHLIVARDGHIRGGQTDWNEGEGFWMGYYTPEKDYRMSIGNETDFFNFDGDQINVSGNVTPQIQVEAGEDIAVGDLCCIRAQEYDQIQPSHDAVVLQSSPTTNFGSDTTATIGATDATNTGTARLYMKFDLDSTPIVSARIAVLRIRTTTVDNPGDLYRFRVTSVTGGDWDESTITWNTKPSFSGGTTPDTWDAIDSFEYSDDFVLSYNDAENYAFFDVTSLFNSNWRVNNFGLVLRYVLKSTNSENTAATARQTIDTSESATETFQPTLIILGANPDAIGKAFKATDDDWPTIYGILGFAKNSASAGENVTIQRDGIVDGLSDTEGNGPELSTGLDYYSASTPGTLTNDPNVVSFRRRIGVALSPTKLLIKPVPPIVFSTRFIATGSDTTSGHQVAWEFPLIIGFIPTKIRFIGVVTQNGSPIAGANGFWTRNGNPGNDGSVTQTSSAVVFDDGFANLASFSETNTEVKLGVLTVLGGYVNLRLSLQDENAAFESNGVDGILVFEE